MKSRLRGVGVGYVSSVCGWKENEWRTEADTVNVILSNAKNKGWTNRGKWMARVARMDMMPRAGVSLNRKW